jgi:predicted site-specific integrase-resolvase
MKRKAMVKNHEEILKKFLDCVDIYQDQPLWRTISIIADWYDLEYCDIVEIVKDEQVYKDWIKIIHEIPNKIRQN